MSSVASFLAKLQRIQNVSSSKVFNSNAGRSFVKYRKFSSKIGFWGFQTTAITLKKFQRIGRWALQNHVEPPRNDPSVTFASLHRWGCLNLHPTSWISCVREGGEEPFSHPLQLRTCAFIRSGDKKEPVCLFYKVSIFPSSKTPASFPCHQIHDEANLRNLCRSCSTVGRFLVFA